MEHGHYQTLLETQLTLEDEQIVWVLKIECKDNTEMMCDCSGACVQALPRCLI